MFRSGHSIHDNDRIIFVAMTSTEEQRNHAKTTQNV